MGIARNFTGLGEKMKAAGYSTALFGKWDAGSATPDATPRGRGYDESLSYADATIDYWTQRRGSGCLNGSTVDLYADTAPAYGVNNSAACSQGNQAPGCAYLDETFLARVRGAIAAHDFSAAPLFLVWAPHIVHTAPNDALEAPQAALDKFAFVDDPYRRAYAAMVNLLDSMQVRIPKPPPHRCAPHPPRL
jgi:arylsulfatase I/J